MGKLFSAVFVAIAIILATSVVVADPGPCGPEPCGSHGPNAHAVVVNSGVDVVANDGMCTLREAVVTVVTHQPSGEAEGECTYVEGIPNGIFLKSGGVHKVSVQWDGPIPIDDQDAIIFIKSDGKRAAKIDCGKAGGFPFDVSNGGNVVLVNVAITGGI